VQAGSWWAIAESWRDSIEIGLKLGLYLLHDTSRSYDQPLMKLRFQSPFKAPWRHQLVYVIVFAADCLVYGLVTGWSDAQMVTWSLNILPFCLLFDVLLNPCWRVMVHRVFDPPCSETDHWVVVVLDTFSKDKKSLQQLCEDVNELLCCCDSMGLALQGDVSTLGRFAWILFVQNQDWFGVHACDLYALSPLRLWSGMSSLVKWISECVYVLHIKE